MSPDLTRRLALASLLGAALAYGCTASIDGNPDRPEDCNDLRDNDNDGTTDCEDTDCANTSNCEEGAEDCKNLADDDGDTLADCDDPDCASNADCLDTLEDCDNGPDDDNDGEADCDDPDCAAAPNCQPVPVESCNNNQDDDGDGAADCADPDCANAANCQVEIPFEIVTPIPGDSFERDVLSDTFEYVTEPLLFTSLANDPSIVEIEYVTENDFSLGVGTAPDFAVTEPFRIDGDRVITAHARNAAGQEVAIATVSFEIRPPVDEACVQRLANAGVNVTVVPPVLGVHTAVRFTSPMKGITYLPFGAANPRPEGELAACSLVEALVAASPGMTARGITKIEHLGIYNFRCIGGGNPQTDDCNPSQHAFATGIDIHELRNASNATFNVETDWVIDPAGSNTCTAATSNAKDELLHRVACDDLHEPSDRFHIVLTPNFNADHRNHFHIDLTNGSNFIQSAGLIDPSWDAPVGD